MLQKTYGMTYVHIDGMTYVHIDDLLKLVHVYRNPLQQMHVCVYRNYYTHSS